MSVWLQPEPAGWWHVVDNALEEDIGPGDVTAGCLDPTLKSNWYINSEADGRLCGAGIVQYLLHDEAQPDPCIHFSKVDGDSIKKGDRIAEGTYRTARTLTLERTALNFLMHLSGVSTLTEKFTEAVAGTNAKIVDTRKTTPGLRMLEKYAVRCGGGTNHRFGLYDGAMIKDNHIKACGSITAAVQRLRGFASHMIRIEVECESASQVDEAILNGVDTVMLDNMSVDEMRSVVAKHKGAVIFEASGGINLTTVRAVAETGVDIISVGQITHSAPSVQFNMELI